MDEQLSRQVRVISLPINLHQSFFYRVTLSLMQLSRGPLQVLTTYLPHFLLKVSCRCS